MQIPVLVEVQVAHDSSVVDQRIERRKLLNDLSTQCGDRRRITDITPEDMNVGQRPLDRLEPCLTPSGDDHRVATLEQLLCHLKTDAAGSIGDQDCSLLELHE